MQKNIQQAFSVSFHYPVAFTRAVFNLDNPTLRELLAPSLKRHPSPALLVYLDEGAARSRPELASLVVHYLNRHLPQLRLVFPPEVIPGGEVVKSDRDLLRRMTQRMVDSRLDRHSYVMAIGGGAVLDAVGFAASLVHRGVRMLRLPTTVLAQNDAGVGVKTAINDAAGKNYFGTFAPPFAVINDLDFLDSLPDEDWRNGIAEAFKVALIKDRDFFEWLCNAAGRLAARNQKAMEHLVVRCAELHLEHIRGSGDPFEMGEARPLDFGHWSAHQLESQSNYGIKHGHAVAVGILLDAVYAELSGWLTRETVDALAQGLKQSGFPCWHEHLENLDADGNLAILGGLERFREHLGGRLCITMPVGVGACKEVSSMNKERIVHAVSELKARNLAK